MKREDIEKAAKIYQEQEKDHDIWAGKDLRRKDVLAARNILRKGISELESKSNSSDINIGVSCVCIQESHLL